VAGFCIKLLLIFTRELVTLQYYLLGYKTINLICSAVLTNLNNFQHVVIGQVSGSIMSNFDIYAQKIHGATIKELYPI
jgi:hypothetical protein